MEAGTSPTPTTPPNGAPKYLVVGHLSLDRQSQGFRLGGTAAYAGLTAAALGLGVTLVTAATAEALELVPPEIQVICLASDRATSFENHDQGGRRSQFLLDRAGPLGPGCVPSALRSSDIVHLAPIADEVDPALLSELSASLLLVTLQGWLRRWDRHGEVTRKAWPEVEGRLGAADVAIVSDEDLGFDPNWIERLVTIYPHLVVTHGADGASVYLAGTATDLMAPMADQLDPTGSGDIFAAAYAIHYHEHANALEAARFANLLASRSVERRGLEGIPSQIDIQYAQEQAAS